MRNGLKRIGGKRFELAEVLFETIRTDGLPLLWDSLTLRAQAARAVPATLQSIAMSFLNGTTHFFSEVRRKGLWDTSNRTISGTIAQAKERIEMVRNLPVRVSEGVSHAHEVYINLPTSRERTEFIVLMAVYSIGYLGGVYLGLSLPHFDAKFFKKHKPQSFVTFHSAPLVSLQIAVDWLSAIIRRSMEHPLLSEQDRDELSSVEKLLMNLANGINTGANLHNLKRTALSRKSKRVPLLGVSLNDRTYHLVEMVFSQMVRREKKES